jgi:hypothetical protein
MQAKRSILNYMLTVNKSVNFVKTMIIRLNLVSSGRAILKSGTRVTKTSQSVINLDHFREVMLYNMQKHEI